MSVTASEQGNTVTIKIDGRFDFSAHQDFISAYRELPKGEKSFVVDLSATEYMDSSAMGMLLQLREHANKSGMIELSNANANIKEILKIANFDKLFNVT
jgi:anti-anti-sigma factor